MSYIKAHDVLPEEIINLIQEYVDGEYLYIPRKSSNKKSWGQKNGTKNIYDKRDREIFIRFTKGLSIKELAHIYFLSEKSIRRIVRKEKLLK